MIISNGAAREIMRIQIYIDRKSTHLHKSCTSMPECLRPDCYMIFQYIHHSIEKRDIPCLHLQPSSSRFSRYQHRPLHLPLFPPSSFLSSWLSSLSYLDEQRYTKKQVRDTNLLTEG